MLTHVPLLGELRLMAESSMRIEDRPCKCKDPEGYVCFQCDSYMRGIAKKFRPDTCTCTELNGEDYVCPQCYEDAQVYEAARKRNQVDADGNVRIGIADFQPKFHVTDDSK